MAARDHGEDADGDEDFDEGEGKTGMTMDDGRWTNQVIGDR